MQGILLWLAELPTPVGASISADALLPLGALAIGLAVGMINIYKMARDAAYDIQYKALARRLQDCESNTDRVRAERDKYRDERDDSRHELDEAHERIAELEAKYERRPNAGP